MMKKLSDKQFYVTFISLFLVLNLLNGLVVSLPIFNPELNLYKFTFQSFFMSLLGDLGFLLMLLGIILIGSRHKRSVLLNLTIVSVILSGIVFALKIYSFYYGTAFSFFNIRTFSNHNPDLGRQLTIFLWKNLFIMGQWIAVIPAIIMIILNVSVYKHRRFMTPNPFTYSSDVREKISYDYITVFKFFLTGLCLYSFSTFTFQYKVEANHNNYIVEDLEAIQNMGVYTYLSNDLLGYLTSSDEKIIDTDSKNFEQAQLYLDESQKENPISFYGHTTNNSEAIFENKTLIMIQLESFNTFLINLIVENPNTGETYEITPFINSLANNSQNLYYYNFFSNIGVGKTSDAEFAALTGIFPDGNIVTYYDYIHEDYETLPKLFSAKGYETYALRGSNRNFYRREEVYAQLGFNPDHLVSEESLIAEGKLDLSINSHKMNGWINDNIIYDKLVEFVDAEQKQFIFSLSTILHSPFMEHEVITGMNGWTEFIPGQIGRYLDYARFTDDALKGLFEKLEEKGVLDDIVFIIYGDHKSDMSIREHTKLMVEAKDLLYNQKISHNVPLIITSKNTDLSAYNASTSLVRGQSDIKRTVVNLFGLDAKYTFGVDILTTDKTITYVPLTMDVFTDDFHLNYRGREVDNPTITEEKISQFIAAFDRFKTLNDLILHNNFFGESDNET